MTAATRYASCGPAPRVSVFLPEARAVLDRLEADGWVDVIRSGREVPGPFTWRSRTRGWRLDHLWASPALRARTSVVIAGPRKPISDHTLLVADVALTRSIAVLLADPSVSAAPSVPTGPW
jgi:exonuclease III